MKTTITIDSNEKNEIPIVFITDNNYVLYTCVVITSLILNKRRKTIYKLYIIVTSEISRENREKLIANKTKNVSVEIMVCSTDHIKDYPSIFHVPNTAYLKYDIVDLFPQYDKILYLDGDIIVTKDLRELYSIQLGDCYLAAVSDMAIVKYFDYFKELNVDNYFNVGMMLLNAKLIRENKIREFLYNEIINPNYLYVEQDILNVICKNRVLWLPIKYNNMFNNYKEPYKIKINDINRYYKTNYKSEKSFIQDSHIIHLCGLKKPWKYSDGFFSKEWMRYYKQSVFRKEKLHLARCNPSWLLQKTEGFFRNVRQKGLWYTIKLFIKKCLRKLAFYLLKISE
jgi:lipopolysaccharide biosynthesis glycosyltransferase